jgi:hypothetical protein
VVFEVLAEGFEVVGFEVLVEGVEVVVFEVLVEGCEPELFKDTLSGFDDPVFAIIVVATGVEPTGTTTPSSLNIVTPIFTQI